MRALDQVQHLGWETFSHSPLNVYQLSEFNLSFYGKVLQEEGPFALKFAPAEVDISDYEVFREFLPQWKKDKEEVFNGKVNRASLPIALCRWTTWADIVEKSHITGVNSVEIRLIWYNPAVYEPTLFNVRFQDIILENNKCYSKDGDRDAFLCAESYLDIQKKVIGNREWFQHTLVSKNISKETMLETVLKENFALRITFLPENQFDMSHPISPFAENKVMASFWDFMDHLHIAGPSEYPQLLNGLSAVKPGIGLDPTTGKPKTTEESKKTESLENNDWGW
ncbi:hypothetical protein L1F30_00120 [Simiduia sp. 21SJ11W-1]|uniref:hypothetical protein n=1 Tax=Simiduia sp. 21SJ11W-1 TaxID=2909669 RepID=UPI00209F0D78|nr:hypothetical protein [Simiduia sp. 21SJ11W-1]UTA47963.1 hypothetical protein L1F30_00120 [Simiduia sp. 21SJ11W-1]